MGLLGIIVLCAGAGLRFGEQKQFIHFMDKPLWCHAYDTAKELAPNNIVAVGVDIPGGETRTESVSIGLEQLSQETTRVIIVESARPLVTLEQLNILATDKHPSVSFVVPLVNTVVFREGEYIDREKLYELLTPQAFDYPLLLNAMRSKKYLNYTDETRIFFDEYGTKAKFIPTEQNLIKITYPKDIPIIERIYEQYKKGE